MSAKIDDQKRKEIEETFKLFDKNGDGEITTAELEDVMMKLGISPSAEELKKMMAEVDADGSGKIELDEFIQLMSSKMAPSNPDEEILAAFKVFDKDGNGMISGDELRTVMTNLGEQLSVEDIDELIKEADTDGNGQIDYQEFLKFVKSL